MVRIGAAAGAGSPAVAARAADGGKSFAQVLGAAQLQRRQATGQQAEHPRTKYLIGRLPVPAEVLGEASEQGAERPLEAGPAQDKEGWALELLLEYLKRKQQGHTAGEDVVELEMFRSYERKEGQSAALYDILMRIATT